MKTCISCGKQLDDQAEFCECGQWFRVARELPGHAPKQASYNEDGQDRILHIWGGACGALAGSTFPDRGALVVIGFFAAGYLLSVGIARRAHSRGSALTGGHKWGLAALYFGAAIIGMVAFDLIGNR